MELEVEDLMELSFVSDQKTGETCQENECLNKRTFNHLGIFLQNWYIQKTKPKQHKRIPNQNNKKSMNQKNPKTNPKTIPPQKHSQNVRKGEIAF